MESSWWITTAFFVIYIRCSLTHKITGPPEPFAPGVERRRGVYIEKWDGIDSFSIDNLKKNARFPYLPTWRGYGSQFTEPENWGENFGSRIRAYFVPKESGPHVFYISSDNGGELYLSKDQYSSHKSLIATVPQERFTKPKQYRKYGEQRSFPVQLQKGNYYFIETLMKEFYDKDHLSVAVQTPKEFVAPISAQYLWTALPGSYGQNNNTNSAMSSIDIIKVAAKAGARAGASSGLMAASQSAARAGAEAGKMAGAQAGAKAGEAAAAAAAQSVFAKTFKAALNSYKLGNLNFDIRLFGPNGEKIVRRFGNKSNTDINTNTTENTTSNHVINIHLYGGNGQSIFQKNPAQQSSLEEEANSYLPKTTNSIPGNTNGADTRRGGDSYEPGFGKQKNPLRGSSGQLIYKQKFVPIDRGRHVNQKGESQKKSHQALDITQEDDMNTDLQFSNIPFTSASLSPDSRSRTPSRYDDSPPTFEPLKQSDSVDSTTPSSNTKSPDSSTAPVFTSINSEGVKYTSKDNKGNFEGTQSTREGEIFVYYPKNGQNPDEVARRLVYEGGPASKIVFNAHYSIHSLDIPAIQINLTKNLCINSFSGKITLKSQCQYFIIREGLLPQTKSDDISLESACIPGHYLVQRNYRFFVDERDGTLHFAREATFALYKTMAFPVALQLMSFKHYMWFMCESKNKDPHKTEILLEYVNSKQSNINRCLFTFLPMPFGWNPNRNCRGVLNFEHPKIRGEHDITEHNHHHHHPGPLYPQPPTFTKETCVALNFVNKAGMPFRLLSDIKQDRYMVTGKNFKLKTIIKRPDLHHHITYRAEDPTGRNTILLYGDSTITILPQHHCDEFVTVEVTSTPGFSPSFGESSRPTLKPSNAKPASHNHFHYHLEPRPNPPQQSPPPSGCAYPCLSSSPCSHSCPAYCCKRHFNTYQRSIIPLPPNICHCKDDCPPNNLNQTKMCYQTCQEKCKEKHSQNKKKFPGGFKKKVL